MESYNIEIVNGRKKKQKIKGKRYMKRRTDRRKYGTTAWSAGMLLLTAICLAACGTVEQVDSAGSLVASDTAEETDDPVSENPDEGTQDNEESETPKLPEAAEPWTDLTPRPIDFPFPYSMENYTLSLVPLRDEPGQYDLRLCNEYGTIVQQFPCGALTEPVTCQYDDLYYDYYADLEIFSADSPTGLLFPFDPNGDEFIEEAIEIPRYEDVDGPNVMVCEENEEYVEKKIYQLNKAYDWMEELRRWHLEKETGKLVIWNCLEQRAVFSGQTALDENWEPVNMKYYYYHLYFDKIKWHLQYSTHILYH